MAIEHEDKLLVYGSHDEQNYRLHHSLVNARDVEFSSNGKQMVMSMPFATVIYRLQPIHIQRNSNEDGDGDDPQTQSHPPIWLVLLVSLTGAVVILLLLFVICLHRFFKKQE